MKKPIQIFKQDMRAYINHWWCIARNPIHTTWFMLMKCFEFVSGGRFVMSKLI